MGMHTYRLYKHIYAYICIMLSKAQSSCCIYVVLIQVFIYHNLLCMYVCLISMVTTGAGENRGFSSPWGIEQTQGNL